MNNNSISVVFADSSHAHYAQRICDLIYESANTTLIELLFIYFYVGKIVV